MAGPQGWIPLLPMGTQRAAANGLCVNDRQFLAIGGQSGPRRYLRSCEYYDTMSELWTACSPTIDMPTNRAFFGATQIGDKVFVMGGKESSSVKTTRSDLICLDLSSCGGDLSRISSSATANANTNWESLQPMGGKRHRFACVSHRDYIYVFGGKNEIGERLSTAERYEVSTNTWSNLPDMPTGAINGSAAGVVGDKIYVVGGFGADGTMLASTLVFDTLTQEWEHTASTRKSKQESLVVPDMKQTRWGLLVIVVEQHFLIAIGGDFDKTIEVLDTRKNDSWNFAPIPMKHDKSVAMAGVSKTGNIIIAGGLVGIEASKTAEFIKFRTGLVPDNVRFEKWKQKNIGDKEATIARALAASYKGYSSKKHKTPKSSRCGCTTPKSGRNGGACCGKPK